MRFDGLRTDPEAGPDLVVRATIDHESYDVELALAQPGEAAHAGSRPDRESHPASGNATDRIEELRERRGLEHESRGAQAEGRLRVLRIVVRREDDDRRCLGGVFG